MMERKSRKALVGMVRQMAMATARHATPTIRKSVATSSPSVCSSAMTSAPPVMKAAFSTLTAAITRARRSAPAQACTAEKVGTMKRPPAMARPAMSMAMRKPRAEPNTLPMPAIAVAGGAAPNVAQPVSSAKTASSTAPISVGSRMMRPCASQAARPEPMAMATEKMAR